MSKHKRKETPIPTWAEEELQNARLVFGVGNDWHVYANWVTVTQAGKESDGSCKADCVYLTANIDLRNKLEQGKYSQRVIFHEVGHVAHSEIDNVVENYILESVLDDTQRQFFMSLYSEALERFLQRLTRGLLENFGLSGQTP